MVGFSSRFWQIAALTLAGIVLVTACTTGTDPALEPPQPIAAEQSSATHSAPATSTPAASTEPPATVSAAGTPEEKPAPSSTPTGTEDQAATQHTESKKLPAPTPTGAVVTEPAADGTLTASAHQTALNNAGACELGSSAVIAAQVGDTAAAGSQYITLTFTNTGTQPCSTIGYPTVSYVDAAGQQIGASAAHAAEWTSNGILLNPGESTTATLRETRASIFGANCQPVSSNGYRVQLPNSAGALTVPFPAEACGNSAIQQLSVGQVGAVL